MILRASGLSAISGIGILGLVLTLGPTPVPSVDSTNVSDAAKEEFSWDRTAPYPEDNAPTEARVALGKALFFEPRLSGSGILSCATCHNPALEWEDGMALAVGQAMDTLGRSTPTILNLAWAPALFWDGRAGSLEEQALGPIQAAGEMNMPLERMLARLEGIPGYAPMFESAYPGESIKNETVAKAIAAYERTIVSGEAPFDRWIAGDESAISQEAKDGFALFTGKANCSACHSGARLTDDSFHDIGVAGDDIGRAAVIPLPSMQHAFKTPTLRNIDRRAPYMHDGSEATLEEVIELYDLGGRERRESLAREVAPLNLTDYEKGALIALMKTFTSSDAPVELPVLPANRPSLSR